MAVRKERFSPVTTKKRELTSDRQKSARRKVSPLEKTVFWNMEIRKDGCRK
jgi:hypothetical protein